MYFYQVWCNNQTSHGLMYWLHIFIINNKYIKHDNCPYFTMDQANHVCWEKKYFLCVQLYAWILDKKIFLSNQLDHGYWVKNIFYIFSCMHEYWTGKYLFSISLTICIGSKIFSTCSAPCMNIGQENICVQSAWPCVLG